MHLKRKMKNRKLYLEASLTEDKNVPTVVSATLAKDAKSLKKAKRDVEDQLEEAEEALEERLSGNTPLDKSVVEVMYAKIKDLKATLELYNEFQKEFLTTEV